MIRHSRPAAPGTSIDDVREFHRVEAEAHAEIEALGGGQHVADGDVVVDYLHRDAAAYGPAVEEGGAGHAYDGFHGGEQGVGAADHVGEGGCFGAKGAALSTG